MPSEISITQESLELAISVATQSHKESFFASLLVYASTYGRKWLQFCNGFKWDVVLMYVQCTRHTPHQATLYDRGGLSVCSCVDLRGTNWQVPQKWIGGDININIPHSFSCYVHLSKIILWYNVIIVCSPKSEAYNQVESGPGYSSALGLGPTNFIFVC